MKLPLIILALTLMLFTLSRCGIGICLDQATCPDGSWGTVGPGATGLTGSFAEFIGSTIHRDRTAPQMLLAEELKGTLAAGNRRVPDLTKDDEGTGTTVTYSVRPSVVCGTTQNTVADRISHCALQNTTLASWDGSANGNSGQGLWKLVTYNGAHEVWRDERTKLLWSDHLGQTNWCRASGSSGGGPYGQVDASNYCDNVANQNQVTPESWCAENAAFNTPGAYDSMKAGMRLAATATSPSVTWRLPTKWDFHQAELDGFRFALPNMLAGSGQAWSATVTTFSHTRAWYYQTTGGTITYSSFRNVATVSVRCVGH